jgi:sugar lactone lactonase YvrE
VAAPVASGAGLWSCLRQGNFRRLLLCGVVAVLPSLAYAAEAAAPQPSGATPATATPKRLPSGPEQRQAKMTSRWVMSLAMGRDGSGWVGTEDDGVWRYDPSVTDGKPWTRYSTQEGLGDDNGYAVACDQQGRIWVGHLNHGVSVFNGQQWKNYDVVTGPLGERVFCITVCPTDGDVWIGTDAGISRYKVKADTWQYYTRAEGLPSDQISAIAFDKAGNAYVGTQCDGLAIAKASEQYGKWRQVDGPLKPLLQHTGEGLPSALINAVLVAHDGTIYVGTPHGLGFSRDGGQSWRYLRGADWLAKAQGQYPTPKVDDAAPGALVEDYVTCLAEDEAGELWIGHWHKGGYEVWDIVNGKRVHSSERDPGKRDEGDYVRSFLLWPGAAPGKNVWVARYMDGTRPEPLPGLTQIGFTPPTAYAMAAPHWPTAATPPQVADLKTIGAHLTQSSAAANQSTEGKAQDETQNGAVAAQHGVYLGEDWVTEGDWVGRYGRQSAVLAGVNGEENAPLLNTPPHLGLYNASETIGPQHAAGDVVRHWVHWLKTDNAKTLYDPELGYRRQAEWDDHGEVYPRTQDGPNLWITVEVPAGAQRVSLYFFDKDGHDTTARYRDYLIQLKPWSEKLEDAAAAPALARARVRDFWGGVYKQFVVQGAGKYLIQVSRNGSHNTICNGVFLDRRGPSPQPYGGDYMVNMGYVVYLPPAVSTPAQTSGAVESRELQAARALWSALDEAAGDGLLATDINREHTARMLAYRAAVAQQAPAAWLGNWRWQLPLWSSEDREVFKHVMHAGWQSFEKLNGRDGS